MKYTTKIIIEKPIGEVTKKMDSIDNMKHWQEGLKSYEHISGTPGDLGAKMKLNYDFGNRKMQLTETITKKNFPEEFHAMYDTKGMHNIQHNYFRATTDNHTEWLCESEFLATNFFMRMMLLVMPKAFKKQTKKYMTNFKSFVENGTSVADA